MLFDLHGLGNALRVSSSCHPDGHRFTLFLFPLWVITLPAWLRRRTDHDLCCTFSITLFVLPPLLILARSSLIFVMPHCTVVSSRLPFDFYTGWFKWFLGMVTVDLEIPWSYAVQCHVCNVFIAVGVAHLLRSPFTFFPPFIQTCIA